jgi:Domain of unknown function (DUF4262)
MELSKIREDVRTMSRENWMDEMRNQENQWLKERGWFAHIVPYQYPFADIHTHGLSENFHHTDIQLVLMFDKATIQKTLDIIVDYIQAGNVIHDGDEIEGLFKCPVRFVKTVDVTDGRPLLRLILPDAKGRFPEDETCDFPYREQLSESLFR